jgi:hypothetical protein
LAAGNDCDDGKGRYEWQRFGAKIPRHGFTPSKRWPRALGISAFFDMAF